VAEIGNILREARIRLGLSVKQVAEITKVRAKYLEALEDDDFKVIPGPTYIKAYLRTYADMLRLDSDALVEAYRSTYERRRDETREHTDLTLEHVRSRTRAKQRKRSPQGARRGYAVLGVLVVIAVVLLAYFTSNAGQPPATLGPDSVGGGLTSTTSADATTTTTAVGDTGGTTTSSTDAVFTGNDFWLRIRATGDCFLVVRDDNENGDILYRDTIGAGEEFNYTEAKRYWVHIANPEVVRVYVNDAQINVPGEGGGRFIITETRIERTD
jgi:cytoskeleton protein RodZ